MGRVGAGCLPALYSGQRAGEGGGPGQGCAGDTSPHTGPHKLWWWPEGGGARWTVHGVGPALPRYGVPSSPRALVPRESTCRAQHGRRLGAPRAVLLRRSLRVSTSLLNRAGRVQELHARTEEEKLSGKGCPPSYSWGTLQLMEWKAVEEV